jgi:hypothetical protein
LFIKQHELIAYSAENTPGCFRAVAAHGVSGQTAAVPVRDRAVVAVYIGDQVLGDVGFHSPVVMELEYMLPLYFVNASGSTRIISPIFPLAMAASIDSGRPNERTYACAPTLYPCRKWMTG